MMVPHRRSQRRSRLAGWDVAARMLSGPIPRTLASLVLCLVGYGVYATAVVPWIEPDPVPDLAINHSAPPPISLPPRFRKLFPPDAWEHAPGVRLETRDGMVWAHKVEQLGKRKIKTDRCTLIWGGSARDTSAPLIVLRVESGAELTFDARTDLQSGEIGEIESAHLMGAVHVQRRQSSDAAPELDLHTSNVHLDSARIWTSETVDFQWRGSQGSGRGMVINLKDPRLDAEAPTDAPAISRVKSFGLDHLENLHLALTSKGQGPSAPLGASGDPRWLDVQCNGPVWIDFDKRVATLDNDVRVFHHGEHPEAEQIRSDTLALYFEPADVDPPPDQMDPAAVAAVPSKSTPKFVLTQVVALGHPVVVDIPTQDASVRCDRLVYRPEVREVMFEPSSEPQIASVVEIRHQKKWIRSPRRVIYSWLLPGNRPNALRIDGPGEYRGPSADLPTPRAAVAEQVVEREMTVTWSEGLTLERRGSVLEITLNADAGDPPRGGPVTVRGHALGNLQANRLRMVLEETLQPSGGMLKGKPFAGIAPVAFQAVGQTSLQSPQIDLRCTSLEGQFLQPIAQQTLEQALSAEPGNHETVMPSSVSVRPATPQQAILPERGASLPTEQWGVRGHTVSIQFESTAGGKWEPTSTTVHGDVDVQRWSRDVRQPLIKVLGERLSMRRPEAPDGFVHLEGQPARIHWGEAILQSDQMHMQSGSGEINIPGPGAVWLPPSQDSEMLNEPVQIGWGGNMQLQGTLATFRGGSTGVVARTPNDLRRARADQCTIQLVSPAKSPFRRTSNRGPSERVEVDRIQLSGNVFIENHTMDGQQRVAVDMAQLPNLEIEQRTGNFLSRGPGWVSRVGQKAASGPFRLASNGPESSAKGGLTYLRVNYERQLRGNLRERKTLFEGRVEVISGPVQTWGEVLDQAGPAGVGPDGVWLRSDWLQANQSPNSRRGDDIAWEIEARDNVRVVSERVQAEGDRLAYNQEKENVILEGSARRDAMLSHRAQGDGTPRSFHGRRLNYWFSTGACEVDGFGAFDFGRIPDKRLPAALP